METNELIAAFITYCEINMRIASKDDLMKIAFGPSYSSVDSELPVDWVNAVRELIPNFDTSYWVWDYRNGANGPVHLLEYMRVVFQHMRDQEKIKCMKALHRETRYYLDFDDNYNESDNE